MPVHRQSATGSKPRPPARHAERTRRCLSVPRRAGRCSARNAFSNGSFQAPPASNTIGHTGTPPLRSRKPSSLNTGTQRARPRGLALCLFVSVLESQPLREETARKLGRVSDKRADGLGDETGFSFRLRIHG